MKPCFMFQWGVCFSFLCVWGRGAHGWGASVLVGGGGFEKNHKMGGAPYASPTMGNPEKNHLTIKNNCSILKKQ